MITGTDDEPTITAANSAVTEDDALTTLTDSGTLTVVDPDQGESAVASVEMTSRVNSNTNDAETGPLGSVTVNSNGTYTFEVANAAVNYLAADETITQTYTVTTIDGSTETFDVVITGTDDDLNTPSATPVITTSDGEVYESALLNGSDDPSSTDVTASGTIQLSDADGLSDIEAVRVAEQVVNAGQLAELASGAVSEIVLSNATQLEYGDLKLTDYDSVNGAISWEYTLNTTVENDDQSEVTAGTQPDDSDFEKFTAEVSDDLAGGIWSSSGNSSITVWDDRPTVNPAVAGDISPGGNSGPISLQSIFGADGFGAVSFSTTSGVVTTDDGDRIFYNGEPLAWSLASNGDLIAGDAITISLSADGNTYAVELGDGDFYVEGNEVSVGLDSVNGGNDAAYALQLTGGVGILIDSNGATTNKGSPIADGGTTNTSNGFIGVDGQWINQGSTEAVSFTFWNSITALGEEESSGGISQVVYNEQLSSSDKAGVSAVSFNIDFQGNAPDAFDMDIAVVGIDGTLGSATVTVDGDASYWIQQHNITWDDSASVKAIQSVSFGALGMSAYRVGLGDITEVIPTDNIDVSVPMTLVDDDGSYDSGDLFFTINQASAPITLDLDNDGVEYLSRDAGVVFTDEATGESVNTAWVAPDDGLLVIDADGSGTVNESKEYVFTEWSDKAETDMEAVAEVFDTNKDGLLNAQDDQFSQFAVWQDANSDGVTDQGELVSLIDMGVDSISLTYADESESGTAADGDVVIHGQSEVTFTDGSTTTAEDTSFAVSAADVLDQEELLFNPANEAPPKPSDNTANSAADGIASTDLELTPLIDVGQIDDGNV